MTCPCVFKGRGEVEEGSLQAEGLTPRYVKLGKRSIDQDTLRTTLDSAGQLTKLKEDWTASLLSVLHIFFAVTSEIYYIYGKVYSPKLDLGGKQVGK